MREIYYSRIDVKPGVPYHIHLVRCDDQWTEEFHTHRDFCEIVYPLSGTVQHRVSSEVRQLSSNAITFVREKDQHSFVEGDWTFVNLAFSRHRLHAIAEAMDLEAVVNTIFQAPAPPVAQVDQGLQTTLHRWLHELIHTAEPLRCRLLFMQVLSQSLLLFMENQAERGTPVDLPAWMVRIMDRLETVDPVQWTVCNLCSWSRKTPEHLSRSFRKYLDETPSQFLNRHKLQRAVMLLRNTNFSIKEVRHASGFESASYFHRQFQAAFGQTPADFRRTMLQD